MDAIDGLFEEVAADSKQFQPPSRLEQEERLAVGKRIVDAYGDIMVNLNVLVEMSRDYLSGHFTEVVTKRYDRAKYEEQ